MKKKYKKNKWREGKTKTKITTGIHQLHVQLIENLDGKNSPYFVIIM